MKTNVQDAVEVLLLTNASLAANASTSGSAIAHGYQRLVGILFVDEATQTASGLHIRQSADYGTNWDYTTASDAMSASTSTACNATVFGNAVEVRIRNGGSIASAVRAAFYLVPI